MKCVRNSEVKIMKSGAGYYLGTEFFDRYTNAMLPWCRLSEQYWRTAEEAQKALLENDFTERKCIENIFCLKSCCSKSCLGGK